jgi:hypothetical protein
MKIQKSTNMLEYKIFEMLILPPFMFEKKLSFKTVVIIFIKNFYVVWNFNGLKFSYRIIFTILYAIFFYSYIVHDFASKYDKYPKTKCIKSQFPDKNIYSIIVI